LSDRQQVERVIEMTAHAALFNLLCVLDGARAIEDGPVKGTLELSYRHGKTNIILNSDDGDILYDLIEAPWRRPKWVSHD
jgi:hypothetical protein